MHAFSLAQEKSSRAITGLPVKKGPNNKIIKTNKQIKTKQKRNYEKKKGPRPKTGTASSLRECMPQSFCLAGVDGLLTCVPGRGGRPTACIHECVNAYTNNFGWRFKPVVGGLGGVWCCARRRLAVSVRCASQGAV